MSSIVANEFAEASAPYHLSSLIAVVVLLMAITLLLNAVARLLVRSVSRNRLDVNVA
jgi:phosphate transport system permease protein